MPDDDTDFQERHRWRCEQADALVQRILAVMHGSDVGVGALALKHLLAYSLCLMWPDLAVAMQAADAMGEDLKQTIAEHHGEMHQAAVTQSVPTALH